MLISWFFPIDIISELMNGQIRMKNLEGMKVWAIIHNTGYQQNQVGTL